ncbi:MAG TPA: hypothetical protein DD490_28425 [Acidobacteria bacterium]|nr:hypothetical protein [Acidobacteriota bacterium]
MQGKTMTSKSLARPSALVLLLPLLLGACGTSRPETATGLTIPAGFNACAILPPERAHAISGQAVAGITSTLEDERGRGALYCPYNAGTIERPQIIGLEVRPGLSAEVIAERMEAARPYLERLSKKRIAKVEGIGDEAYWVPGMQQLHCRKGRVQIIATVQAGAQPLDDAKRLVEDSFAAMEKAAAAEAQKKGKAGA